MWNKNWLENKQEGEWSSGNDFLIFLIAIARELFYLKPKFLPSDFLGLSRPKNQGMENFDSAGAWIRAVWNIQFKQNERQL